MICFRSTVFELVVSGQLSVVSGLFESRMTRMSRSNAEKETEHFCTANFPVFAVMAHFICTANC